MTNNPQVPAGSGHFAPLPPDPHTYKDLGRFRVDGETFHVRRRDDDTYLYEWASGPNHGYGFAESGIYNSADSTVEEPTEEHHRQAIRDFLSNINPESGYL